MGQEALLIMSVIGTACVVAFVALLGATTEPQATEADLTARAAQEAPDFQPSMPMLRTQDGALIAIEKTGRRLALLLPHGAHLVFWLLPATRARLHQANPALLTIETGDLSRPRISATLPDAADVHDLVGRLVPAS